MPILIDGHNLIGRLPELSLQDPDDEQRLVSLLKSYQARTGKRIAVVFDPGTSFALPEVHHSGQVEVVFAPHGTSADAVIDRRVSRSRNPRGFLVITSDRGLAESVTRHGARIRSAEEFAAELRPQSGTQLDSREIHLSPDEIDAWLALFSQRE